MKTAAMSVEACAIEAVNLAKEINQRQERLETLKVMLRSHAATALVGKTGKPYGLWEPSLPAPYAGSITVTVPPPVLGVSKEHTLSHIVGVMGLDAYQKYFTERVVVTVQPVDDFRDKVLQEESPGLRERVLSFVSTTNPTARVSLRPPQP